jgi:hypothetical protein
MWGLTYARSEKKMAANPAAAEGVNDSSIPDNK